MGKLTRDEILKLAKLARLQLTDEEVEKFSDEISAILGYIDQLQSVNLTGVETTNQVTGLVNVMRKDEVYSYSVTPEQLLKNAPETEDGQIKVKRMLA